MKHFLPTAIAGAMMLSGALASYGQAPSRVYGIQTYSDTEPEGTQKLVSFSVDDPSNITVEQDLSQYTIVAAAAYDGIYYMFHSDDGMVPSKFLTYDVAHKTITEVKNLDFNFDEAACLVILDMTYDMSDQQLYAVAADLRDAEVVDGSINAPFGLYKINPENGDAELVGYEEITTLTTIAAGYDELWGIDEEGNFWLVDRWSGMPQDILYPTGIEPAGLQSMSYDMENNCFYWASLSLNNQEAPTSNLICIDLGEEWDVSMTELGKIGENLELIGLYVDSSPVNPDAPQGVTDLLTQAATGGLREVTLTWTNPSENMRGEQIDTPLTITIYRDDEKVGELTGNAGEKMSWTDNTDSDALFTYSVVASSGDLEGACVYASPVFVGTDIPGAPLNVKAERETSGYGIRVNWEAPKEGKNGGWFDGSDLHYTVTRYPDNKIVAENIASLTYTDNDITAQEGYSYGIKVHSDNTFGPEAVSNVVVSGKAIVPPYLMTLTEQDELLWTVWNGDGDEYTWFVHRTGWGGTWDPMFRYYPENTVDPTGKANDWIISPSFELKAGKKYIVNYDVRLLGVLFPANTSVWIGSQANPEAMTEKLASFENEIVDMNWETRTIPLTVDKDGAYNIGYKVENRVPVQLMNFSIQAAEEIDIEASTLTGPTTLASGTEETFRVGVRNVGFENIEKFTLSLCDANETILKSETVEKEIKPGESTVVDITWTPQAEGKMTIVAKVEVDGETNVENNLSSPLNVSIIGDGSWVDVVKGNSSTGFAPFNCSQSYSASQTIYPADLLTSCKDKEIKAINYYLDICRKDVTADLEVWLGTTSMTDFTSNTPVAESELTKVFSGTVALAAGDERVTIMLDTPYEYSGDNLVIFIRSKVDPTAMIAFKATYLSKDVNHSLVEANSTSMFDFSQEMQLTKDFPDLTLLVSGNTGGIEVPVGNLSGVVYNRASRSLHVNGEFELCRVYTADGMPLATFGQGETFTVPASVTGIGIVEVTKASGKTISKIIF